MKNLFYPITREVALADLAELPSRIQARTHITKRGPEGRHLREQASQQLRWHRLFITLSRRTHA